MLIDFFVVDFRTKKIANNFQLTQSTIAQHDVEEKHNFES